jgi:hypothetical protein
LSTPNLTERVLAATRKRRGLPPSRRSGQVAARLPFATSRRLRG